MFQGAVAHFWPWKLLAVPFEENVLSLVSRLLCLYLHVMANQLSVCQNLKSSRRQNAVCVCDGLTPDRKAHTKHGW